MPRSVPPPPVPLDPAAEPPVENGFHAETRQEWREWLAANHATAQRIWLVTWKKATGLPTLTEDDWVEEALCFGWIDSTPGFVDERRSKRLLARRKRGSPWSALNKRRIEKLLAEGRMTPAGLAAIEAAKADGSWGSYDEVETLVEPPDLRAALEAAPEAGRRWAAFAPSSRKGVLWWIVSAKTASTRAKRIAETVRLAGLGLRANFPESRGK